MWCYIEWCTLPQTPKPLPLFMGEYSVIFYVYLQKCYAICTLCLLNISKVTAFRCILHICYNLKKCEPFPLSLQTTENAYSHYHVILKNIAYGIYNTVNLSLHYLII